jgi:predicted heme/steroid binding protein
MSGSGSGAAPAAPAALAAGGAAAASSEPVGRIITLEELATHKTLKSAWIAVNGGVFDATSYMDEHPGGSEQIMNFAGRDATKDWEM